MPPALDSTTPMGSLAYKALQEDHAKRFDCSKEEHQEIYAILEVAKEKAEAPRLGMDITTE